MKAKQYLLQLQKMDSIIDQNIAWLSELKKIKGDLKATDYTKEKVKSSKTNCANFENIIIKIIDMEHDINDKIDEFVDRKQQIIKQIQSLDNYKYMQVLYKRYVEYKRLEVIAVEMHYTYQHIKRIHIVALKKFESCYSMLP